jgi:hypothetical protein
LGGAALAKPDQHAQVDDDRGEDISRDPTAGLLRDRLPRWEIMGHGPPLEAVAGNEPKSAEELSREVLVLRTGNAWAYHALAPHTLIDTPLIARIFGIR